MLEKRGDWGIYKNQRAVAEIRDALERSEANGGSKNAKIAAMADVIRRQTAHGIYVSDHLKSQALDFSVKDLSARERAILVAVSWNHARKVLDEHVPQHVQY